MNHGSIRQPPRDRRGRLRRSCLAVPGSSLRMLEKAQALPADQVFLDLEDSVAPSAKREARQHVVAALRDGRWTAPTLVVRVNDCSTPWTHRDLLEVVGAAGDRLDAIMVPKVEDAGQVRFVDILLTQLELEHGWEPGRIGLEIQLESATGLVHLTEIARASDRIEALIFGPGDMSASLGKPTLTVGAGDDGYGSDPWHAVLMQILVTARSVGAQAIDGPFAQIRDLEGYRAAATRSAALGFDGKWVLHPGQLDVANAVYSLPQATFERASDIVDAYANATEGRATGAVMFGSEMIDEATRKMASEQLARGRRQGLQALQVPAEVPFHERATWRQEQR